MTAAEILKIMTSVRFVELLNEETRAIRERISSINDPETPDRLENEFMDSLGQALAQIPERFSSTLH
jgi:hypothetical protein